MEDSALKSEKNCNVWKIHTTCHYMLTLFNIKGQNNPEIPFPASF